jgi:predicted DNA-binding mobile mystery protein A
MATVGFSARHQLDQRLAGLEQRIGPPPPGGWVKVIREALGMSQYELAVRMGVTQPRVAQLEHAEVVGSMQLATLERAAAALNCVVRYVLAPVAPLQEIVCRQALEKAAALDRPARVDELIDRPGLWRATD